MIFISKLQYLSIRDLVKGKGANMLNNYRVYTKLQHIKAFYETKDLSNKNKTALLLYLKPHTKVFACIYAHMHILRMCYRH